MLWALLIAATQVVVASTDTFKLNKLKIEINVNKISIPS